MAIERQHEAPPSKQAYREWLVQAHHGASKDFDKAVMTLAGGALAISLAFVRDYAPRPEHEWLLATSWGLLSMSLLTILCSFLASQEEILRRIGEVDYGKPLPRLYRWATRILNYTSGVTFLAGVGFLVTFALSNL